MSSVILSEAVLSLLGLGIQAPGSSLGIMISQAIPDLKINPFQVFVPSLMLTLLVLAFSFLGEWGPRCARSSVSIKVIWHERKQTRHTDTVGHTLRCSADCIGASESFVEYEPLYTPRGFAATTPTSEQIQARMSEGPIWVAVQGDTIVGHRIRRSKR